MSKDILVVGGGLTGMTAALEAAKAGYHTILVEKEAQLGGFQSRVQKIATFPYKDLQDNNLDDLVQAVTQHEKIKVYTGATMEQIDGGPGVFKVSIQQNGSSAEHGIGAIVMAAGWQPYDPERGYFGELPGSYLPARRGGVEVVRFENVDDAQVRYSIRQVQPFVTHSREGRGGVVGHTVPLK